MLTIPGDLYRAVRRFLTHDGPVLAGHLAYLTLLAILPFFLFLVAFAGFFGNTERGAHAIIFLLDAAPEDLQLALEGPVTGIIVNASSGTLTVLALIGAIWISSSALAAARLAIDRAFEGGHPPAFWLRRMQGIGLVLFATIGILLGMTVFVLGPVIWNAVIYLAPGLEDWTEIAVTTRFLVSGLLVYLAIAALYFALKPRHKGRFAPVAQGALLTLCLWFLIGAGFSKYIRNFTSYDATYGALGGAIIALVFFYLISCAFILGAELNAVVAERRATNVAATDKTTGKAN